MTVPSSLKKWFIFHFIVDILFAIPLLFFPGVFLSFWGFLAFNSLTARMTGAALMGIGLNSYLMSRKGVEVYCSMLTLKIVWSVSAIIAIVLTIMEGGPSSLYLFLSIFIMFSMVWTYYKIRMAKETKEAP
jgi:hypothetical protein